MAYVSCHRDLENIIDNQISGENDQDDCRHNAQDNGKIHGIRKLCSHITPVDTEFDIIVFVLIIILITVFFQNGFQIVFD